MTREVFTIWLIKFLKGQLHITCYFEEYNRFTHQRVPYICETYPKLAVSLCPRFLCYQAFPLPANSPSVGHLLFLSSATLLLYFRCCRRPASGRICLPDSLLTTSHRPSRRHCQVPRQNEQTTPQVPASGNANTLRPATGISLPLTQQLEASLPRSRSLCLLLAYHSPLMWDQTVRYQGNYMY